MNTHMNHGAPRWWDDAIFYHIYPLGFCGAPERNDGQADPTNRLTAIVDALPEVAALGCNALYLGPVFESVAHGYDTTDYRRVDRRLGANADLRHLVDRAHDLGIRVILDGVFNHVGREYGPFRDVREHRSASRYRDWFKGLDFSTGNRWGDGFSYTGWEGNDELVSLNLDNPEVRDEILAVVDHAVEIYGIDGLRLDVAYLLPEHFLRELRTRCESISPDLWLMGEVIHGAYDEFVRPGMLHAVTNYESYKGLWSSFNDANLHEIAWTLKRLFGDGGLLLGEGAGGGAAAPAYNFADNHDVDRVIDSLDDSSHLFPLYLLLYTMPGIPSLYYGSEWMVPGAKRDGDRVLRPTWHDVDQSDRSLRDFITELARLRAHVPALRYGTYREISVASEQLAFARNLDEEAVVIAVNAADAPAPVRVCAAESPARHATCLFSGERVHLADGALHVPARGGRIVRVDRA